MHQTAVQHEESAREQVRERCDTFRSKSCGYRKRIARSLTSLLRQQMPLRLREGQTSALACLTLMDEEDRASDGGIGEGRDG